MGSTKAQPSFRTGWARPRTQSGVMLAMSALSITTARVWKVRDRPRTVRTDSLHPFRAVPVDRVPVGRAWTRRIPSAIGSTWPACSSGIVGSRWMMASVRPLRCVRRPSWTTFVTVGMLEPTPAVRTPMAISVASVTEGVVVIPGEDGPRSTPSSLGEESEESQVVAQVSGDEKIPADVLTPRRAHAADQLGIPEEMPDAEGGAFDGLHRIAGHPEYHLIRDPAREAAHHGLAFPHGSGHVDAEAGGERLVDHDGRAPLQRIHLCLGVGGQHDHAHVGIVAGRFLYFREHVTARARRRAGQYEPDVVMLLYEAVCVDHAQGIVRAAEGADL